MFCTVFIKIKSKIKLQTFTKSGQSQDTVTDLFYLFLNCRSPPSLTPSNYIPSRPKLKAAQIIQAAKVLKP
jgi:hypothetical protein